MAVRQNYLNNRDIMDEIHKSKTSFSTFTQPEYHQYDIILQDLEEINEETITEAKKNRAKRLTLKEYEHRKATQLERPKMADCDVPVESITTEELVFRIMTFDHIPMHPGRKKTPKTIADHKERVNFPPFQHWKFSSEDVLVCVGKSHWKGDLDNGGFCKTHGKITDKLARMYMKLCERYSTRGNIRGYTYVDEMKDQAILQLVLVGLQFNEAESSNPFSYLTSALTNAQIRVINIEKKHQVMRDELLEINGLNPSFTRIADYEHDFHSRRESEY